MAQSYHLTVPRRVLNTLMRALLRMGIAPPGTYLLTVRGRNTGTLHSTPVTIVERDGERWLVAPYAAEIARHPVFRLRSADRPLLAGDPR